LPYTKEFMYGHSKMQHRVVGNGAKELLGLNPDGRCCFRCWLWFAATDRTIDHHFNYFSHFNNYRPGVDDNVHLESRTCHELFLVFPPR